MRQAAAIALTSMAALSLVTCSNKIDDRSTIIPGPPEDPFELPGVPSGEPTFVVAGVEIFDAAGSLTAPPEVMVVATTELSPTLGGAVAGWSFAPSQTFAEPIVIRLPAPEGVAEGDELLVFTDSPDLPVWSTQTRSVVNDNTMLMQVWSFSTKALVSEDVTRLTTTTDIMAAFQQGLDCETGSVRVGQEDPVPYNTGMPTGKETLHCGAIASRLSYEQATCVLRDISSLEGSVDFLDRLNSTQRWEDRYVHPNVSAPLERLIDLVKERTCDRVKLIVTAAYQEGGHADASLHWEGRALDLQLWEPNVGMHTTTEAMTRLGRLALVAGFDWVIVHRGESPNKVQGGIHVHASVKGTLDKSTACWLCATDLLGCQCVEQQAPPAAPFTSGCSTEYNCCLASRTGGTGSCVCDQASEETCAYMLESSPGWTRVDACPNSP